MSETRPRVTRFCLPGLNLTLNWTPRARPIHPTAYLDRGFNVPPLGESDSDLFPSALNALGEDSAMPLTTLKEFTMLHLMDEITDKTDWELKMIFLQKFSSRVAQYLTSNAGQVFNDAIAQKWKAEAMSAKPRDVSQKMADWVIEELRHRAESFKDSSAFQVYKGDVVKSDAAIPPELKADLQAACRALEDVPETHKDYHPGSDGKVVDLVHPSLFPLIYGRSRVLDNVLIGLDDCVEACGTGSIIPVRPNDEMALVYAGPSGTTPPYGKHFQWLPCEVDISGDGARITSYVNNLHPKAHCDLYRVIESVITKTLPLWNMTLTPLANSNEHGWPSPRIVVTEVQRYLDPDEVTDADRPLQKDDEDGEDYSERIEDWEYDPRVTIIPEPSQFHPAHLGSYQKVVDLKQDFGHRGLQIIVKLANIELTPDNPEYEGGAWHVEGQLNEHICATALYYYSSSNITPSRLAFRQQSIDLDAEDMPYAQNDHEWLEDIFGCVNDGPAVQEVGSVLCREGRLLTFPNLLQHRVLPFKLQDPTKDGHRKILALFLVDPNIRIISTANVPPQQKHWWSEVVDEDITKSGKWMAVLSNELREQVFNAVEDFPLGMDEAKEIRLQLMKERSHYSKNENYRFEETRTFSLCEH